jgi:hypothetical protein
LIRLLLAGTFLFGWMCASTDAAEINIGYLRRTDPKSTLSLIQTPANNDGIAGARLAIDDNNTTGKFLNQQFSLEDVRLAGGTDAVALTIALAERGVSLVIADLPADELLKAADAGGPRKVLFFNVGASDGDSASRTHSTDPKAMLDFLKGPDFALAAFKGQRLTLRDWNLQLRQPILLSDGRTIVSVSPQEGFLHQVSELDTLGIDRPESHCRLK